MHRPAAPEAERRQNQSSLLHQRGGAGHVPAAAPERYTGAQRLGLFAVVVVALVLRITYYQEGGYPDEAIAVGVVDHLRLADTWDTNWANAPLPEPFRYDQYNFSSFHVALSLFDRTLRAIPGVATWWEPGGLRRYRLFTALLGTVVVVQTVGLARRFTSNLPALGAGLWAAVTPILVQDAHYVRPEAFFTALTLVLVSLSCQSTERGGRPLLAGFVFGVAVACKISALLLIWLPFAALAGAAVSGRRRLLVAGGIIGAMGVGFALGAPGALLNPGAFLHGIEQLLKQYAGHHPPHSHLPGRATVDLLFGYIWQTAGWLLGVGAAAGLLLIVRRRAWRTAVFIALPVALYFGYFSTKWVFFERNLSHVIPLYLVLAAVGLAGLGAWWPRCEPWRSSVIAALVVLASVQPFMLTHRFVFDEFSGAASARQEAFDAALRERYPAAEWREETLVVVTPLHALEKRMQSDPRPVLLRVADYHDDWNARHLPLLHAHFQVEPLAERASSFARVPVSTLHTYHRPRFRYFLVTGLRQPLASGS